MSRLPEIILRNGEKTGGFTVARVMAVEQARSIAYELVHDLTGAKLIHLHNDDTENLFSITFPTPPPDDTGLPHILEHSVLGGSEKFAVKDPFFAIVKSSMATFINAMTGSDYTVYPVATNVKADFYNLADVYWDAVFHPTLSRQTFAREGHHLELTKANDASSELIIKGIVYNEMKGSRSSPDSKVFDLIEKSLWPDTPYGKDSGGDPDIIPQLTYEQFKQFHRTYYHPSNAYIFLYGNIPTTEHLAFLSGRLTRFASQPVSIDLPPQPRWPEPRVKAEKYAVGAADTTTEKTFITMSWLLGSAVDEADVLALAALDRILLGNQGAPLRKALVESRLGRDVTHSGFWAHGKESSFHIGLKGSEPERTGAVQSLVLETLARVAREGVKREQVDAAFQQLSYHYLEIGSNYPLALMGRVTHFWMHGQDPFTALFARDQIRLVYDKYLAEPRFFSRLIEDRLLHNTHRLTLTVSPDTQLQSQHDAAFKQSMAKRKAAMNAEELQQVVQEQNELERLLSEPNTPEALAALPILRVSDLPRRPREIATQVLTLPHGELLHNDVYANGVNYLQVSFDLRALDEDLQLYLPLYCACVSKMGAAGLDYSAMAQRVAAFTGGVGFSIAASTRVDEPLGVWRGQFGTKFVDANAGAALEVLDELMFKLDLNDDRRFSDILQQTKAHHRGRPAHDGLTIATRYAGRLRSAEGMVNELWSGISQTHLIERVATAPVGQTLAHLRTIGQYLKESGKLVVSFTGSDRVFEQVHARAAAWDCTPAPAVMPALQNYALDVARTGLASPMNVAYCVASLSADHVSSPISPLLQVASRLLSFDYVLEEVRFKGTAYGGGCSYDGRLSQFNFHSYRDPWIGRTLDVYREARDFVERAQWTQADIDRAIIGTVKEFEHPIRPGEATGSALWRHVSHDTPERRAGRQAGMLGATPDAIKTALLGLLEQGWLAAQICVVSSREKLEQSNIDRPGEPLAIADIIPNNT